MERNRVLTILGLTLGLSGYAHATCTGGGDPCNAPRTGSIAAHTATTLTESVQNAATPNVTNSVYFFQATTLGSPQNSSTPDSKTIVALTEDFTSPATGNDIIVDIDKPLLASTNYTGYAMACPPGTSTPGSAGCSAWVNIGTQVTDALTNAGFNNIAAADTAPQQFTARTNNAVVDQTDVAAWLTTQLTSTEVGNCALSKNLQPFPTSGNASLTITSADCNTLFPNRPYKLTENLEYFPTQAAPSFTSGVFYTQAANPLPINPATSVTHCSATLTFQNASASPANPSDTTYSVNVGGAVSAGSATQTKAIGGTGVFGDQNSVTYTNLVPGTTYNPTVTALNRGGAPWLNSTTENYSNFTTAGTAGTFTPQNIGTTTTDIAFSNLDLTGVTAYQIILNGANFGSQVSGAPTSPIHLTGLTPNTQYAFKIQLFEASCSFIVPTTAATFTTTPTAPSVFTLAPVAGTINLTASWTVGAGDPANTTYQVTYCQGATITGGCPTKNVPNNGNTTTLTGLVEETQYTAEVKAITVGGGLDSAFSNTATATTNNLAPVVPVPTCTQIGVTNSATCSVTGVVDNDLGNGVGVVYQWDLVTPVGGTSFTPASTSGSSSNNNTTTFAYPSAQSYDVRVTVIDHNGTGLSTSNHVIFNPGQIPTTITVAPTSDTVATGQSTSGTFFTATVKDQNGTVIPNQPVNWSINGAGNSVTSASGAQTGVTAGSTTGVFTLTASLPGATSGTASITIVPFLTANSLKLCATGDTACNKLITIKALQNQQFTVTELDQFGNPITFNPSNIQWTGASTTAGASASFASSTIGQNFVIKATDQSNNKSDSITVNVVSFDVSGAFAYPVPFKASSGLTHITFTGLGNQWTLHIYTTSGRRVFDISGSTNVYPWSIQNSSGESIASGVYFYVIESPEGKKNGKLIIIQ